MFALRIVGAMSCGAHLPHSVASPSAETKQTVVAERYKTKLCRNYAEKGACPYESRCMFAHGPNELRTVEMNVRDGLVNEEALRNFKRSARSQPSLLLSSSPAPPSPQEPSATTKPPHVIKVYTHNPYNLTEVLNFAEEVVTEELQQSADTPTKAIRVRRATVVIQ